MCGGVLALGRWDGWAFMGQWHRCAGDWEIGHEDMTSVWVGDLDEPPLLGECQLISCRASTEILLKPRGGRVALSPLGGLGEGACSRDKNYLQINDFFCPISTQSGKHFPLWQHFSASKGLQSGPKPAQISQPLS